MAKVFISHSSKQKEFVEKIVYEIGRDNCFVDIYDFHSSEKIASEIDRFIDGCDIFAIFLSRDAWTSSWVRYELAHVRDYVDHNRIIFRPYIIDENFSISEITNMDWVKSYIIDIIPRPIIIARALAYDIRQLKFREFPYLKFKDYFFFGREEDKASLIAKYYGRSGIKALFVSGIPLIGRKRFAKEMMHLILQDNRKDFVSIEMRRDESIDVFLLKLNDIVGLYDANVGLNLASDQTELKIKKTSTIDLLNKLFEYKQELLIIDDGCVVQHGGNVADWFKDIIISLRLESHIGIYVCSKIAIRRGEEDCLPILAHRLSPVANQGIETLVRAYSKERSLPQDNVVIRMIVNCVQGSPRFVYDAIDCWKEYGAMQLKEKMVEIEERKKNVISTILDDTLEEESKDKFQLLLLLSKFETMSYELLEALSSVSGLSILVEELKSMSIIEEFGASKEYFRLHPVILDYVRRIKKKLTPENEAVLHNKAREILVNMNNNTIDLSQQLFAIREWIASGGKNRNEMDGYLIPSIALKVIIEAYDMKKYSSVIDLSDRLLEHENRNYQHLTRTVKYWLCCALCRQQNERLFLELPFFSGTAAYHFLLGFYYRIGGFFDKAESEYQKVLDRNNNYEDTYIRAKEELVLVKIKMGQYGEALQLAEENYNHRPYNPYFIVSYFRCLVKSKNVIRHKLVQLINEIKKVSDPNSYVNITTMEAELSFYSDHDYVTAVDKLKVVLKSRPRIDYPQNALREICKKRDALKSYDSIMAEIGNLQEEYEIE